MLNVLPVLFEFVQIPLAVAEELAQGRRHGIDLPEVKQVPWLSVKTVSGKSIIIQIANLGKGENEVIALELESSKPLLVLDDRKARRFASSVGLEITGTMGILVLAKKRSLIESVQTVLDHLQVLQFRMDDKVKHAILHLVDEKI